MAIETLGLLKVLEAMGQKPTEEELFQMISEVDDNMSGSIDFPEFLKVLQCCARAWNGYARSLMYYACMLQTFPHTGVPAYYEGSTSKVLRRRGGYRVETCMVL